jgi:RinA family phage transcriptional activator
MAKTKPAWWNYVKKIIREYPKLQKEIMRPLEPKITSTIGTGGHGSGVNSPTEGCVIHNLPKQKQKKYDAIENAIEKTKQRYNITAADRLKVIDLVYWKETYTLAGAALQIHVHENTAGTYSADFIRLVAEELELP